MATFSIIYLNSQNWKWLLPNLIFGVTVEILVGVGLTLWNSFLFGTNVRSFCFTYTGRLLLPGICPDNAFVTVIHLIFAVAIWCPLFYFLDLTCILAFYRVFGLSWHILVSHLFIIQNLSKIQPLTLSVADFFAFVRHFVLSDMLYKGNAIDQRVCFSDRHPTVQKLIKRPPEVFYDCVVCPPRISERNLKTGRGTGSFQWRVRLPSNGAPDRCKAWKFNHIKIISKSYRNHKINRNKIVTKSYKKMKLCIFYDFDMISIWFRYDFVMIWIWQILWFVYGFGVLRFFGYDFDMIFLWFWSAFEFLIWFCFGVRRVFACWSGVLCC